MKVITLWDPWASFVICGLKTVETRSWDTKYRGWLGIHVAKQIPRHVLKLCNSEPLYTWIKRMNIPVQSAPKGVLLGKVQLLKTSRIINESDFPWFERQFGDYTPGRYAWIFGSVVRYRNPIPVRGYQGLWEFDFDEATAKPKIVREGIAWPSLK
jgi:hypothetical protein